MLAIPLLLPLEASHDADMPAPRLSALPAAVPLPPQASLTAARPAHMPHPLPRAGSNPGLRLHSSLTLLPTCMRFRSRRAASTTLPSTSCWRRTLPSRYLIWLLLETACFRTKSLLSNTSNSRMALPRSDTSEECGDDYSAVLLPYDNSSLQDSHHVHTLHASFETPPFFFPSTASCGPGSFIFLFFFPALL